MITLNLIDNKHYQIQGMGKKSIKSPSTPRIPSNPDHNPTPMVTGLPYEQQLLVQPENSQSSHDLLHYKISKQKKVKLGRPSNHEKAFKNVLKYNQIDSIKNCFVIYLDEIGFRQGLVFSVADRKKLREEADQKKEKYAVVEWDTQHKWLLAEQQQKIARIIKQQEVPDIYTYQKLSNHLLDIADIFPRQITGEIYRFLCQLYKLSLKFNEVDKEDQDQLIKDFVKSVCGEEGQFVFIVGRFSQKFRPALKDLSKPMVKLCENILKYIRQLIKN